MSEVHDLLIVGGSLSGLLGAVLAKSQHPHWSVVVVEREDFLGGNLRGVDVLDDHFELGTHLLQETGTTPTDLYLRESVPAEDLVVLDSHVGDRVGTIQGGRVFENTGYPAVNEQDPVLANLILDDIIQIISQKNAQPLSISELRRTSLEEATIKWFGENAWSALIKPLVSTKFGSGSSPTGLVLELANLSRLQVASEDIWLENSDVEGFRARVAYPQQLHLPENFRHNRKTIYSRRYGNRDFVAGLIARCRDLGVVIMSSCSIVNLDPATRSVEVRTNGRSSRLRFKRAISCLGLNATRRLIDNSSAVQETRMTLHLVHLTLNMQLSSPICYFYDHHPESNIFRITNYGAFSGRTDDRRLTVELFNMSNKDTNSIVEYVINSEAIEAVVPKECKIVAASCLKSSGFVLPTVQGADDLLNYDQFVRSQYAGVLEICGVGTRGLRFFQSETTKDVARVIMEMP